MPMPSAAPSHKRPFRVLPPITRGPEALDGTPLLEEVAGDAGVLLWQSLRNVMLWAGAVPAERAGLFSPEAAARRAEMLRLVPLDEPLRSPMATVAAMLAAPAEADAGKLAYACARVATWAEERGAPATALAFAQAAALARPDDAALACAVGRLARLRGETVRAEGWYHKAVTLARQSGDWRSYALAFLGLGNAALQRGNLPAARRSHTRALRAARRHRLRAIQAWVLHDMFVTAVEGGDPAEADACAARALRAYGDGHPRVPMLAHDVAMVWLLRGEHARALPVLQAVLPCLRNPAERVVAQANVARAAAGAGHAGLFRAAALETTRLLLTPGTAGAAQAYLTLAHAALALGDREHAEAAAGQARRFAAESGEAKTLSTAEEILETLRAGAAPAPAPAAREFDLDAPGELAGELVRSLELAASSH